MLFHSVSFILWIKQKTFVVLSSEAKVEVEEEVEMKCGE